jgi:hypothetical protein
MALRLRIPTAALLAVSLVVVTHAQSGDQASAAKRHTARRSAQPAKPSLEDQIQALRQEMQSQIDSLKSSLAEKDEQLRQAQQAAADAQAAAAKAEAAATAQQQAVTENTSAVNTLQSTVTDLKSNSASLAGTISDETSSIKKQIANPDTIHYKGITISPAGSFIAAETTYRSGATGGDVNTPFTGVPLQNSEAYNVSEFFGTGRQSRIALKAQGKLDSMTLTGYYEMDWLSAGVTSNNNQSNSYTVRQRQLWADAKLANGWDFSGGQGWSLAAETTQGLTRGTEILPATIDAQYEPGFVWARQYSFRISKDIGKSVFIGASAENAQTLNPSGEQNIPNYLFIGSTGTGGGLFNGTANYAFNVAPDMIAKIAVEPGWGHWELFGISSFFRDRIYPGTDAGTTSICNTTPCNNTVVGGGVGGGFRGPLFDKKVTIGLKGLYGDGVGRYGSSAIADVTFRPDGVISPLHGFSALSTVEMNPTPRLNIYMNYGGDYIGRDWALSGNGTEVGYGTYTADMSGCNTENSPASSSAEGNSASVTPSHCTDNIKDVQEGTLGYWFNFYSGPKGRLRQGIQYSYIMRYLWAGAGGVNNPGGGAMGGDNMLFTSFRYYLP